MKVFSRLTLICIIVGCLIIETQQKKTLKAKKSKSSKTKKAKSVDSADSVPDLDALPTSKDQDPLLKKSKKKHRKRKLRVTMAAPETKESIMQKYNITPESKF